MECLCTLITAGNGGTGGIGELNSGTIINDMANQYAFTDLSDFAHYIREIRAVNAFNAILIWTKTVKYVEFIP